jgi:hypothetical protein
MHRELFEEWKRENAGKEPGEREPRPAAISHDATTEAMSDILVAIPRGIWCINDEFESWLGSHDAYRGTSGGSRDRGEWLKLYDGGVCQINRITRGAIFVPNWGCSILSATTPGALKELAPKLPSDGLLQRFMPVLVASMQAPDVSICHVQIDEARARYEATVRRLYALGTPTTVRLGREAREIFEGPHAAAHKRCPPPARPQWT